MMIRTAIAIAIAIVGACAAVTLLIACALLANGGDICSITKNFEAAIPDAAEKPLIAMEVGCAPGAAPASLTQAKSTFIYFNPFSLLTAPKPNDGDTRAYRSVESRCELACAIHSISRNASMTSAAKLLAGFFLDTNANEPTSPITMSG